MVRPIEKVFLSNSVNGVNHPLVLQELFGRSPGYGLTGSIVILAYLWLPYMILPIYASLERIDRSLIAAVRGNVVELTTGCLCCGAGGDVTHALVDLARRAEHYEIAPFNRVVIETTGIADPAPLVPTLMLDARITARYLPPGSRVLEGGCGRANKVKALADAGFAAVGVDYAAESVELARQVYPGLDIQVGDVRMLPFPDGAFDGYWSIGVIEHFWAGYDDILREARRVLKPGGVLIPNSVEQFVKIIFAKMLTLFKAFVIDHKTLHDKFAQRFGRPNSKPRRLI